MDTDLKQVVVTTLYLLTLITPISKISVLTVLHAENRNRDLGDLTRKSSVIAAGILLGSVLFGEVLLQTIFHVEIYSLRLTGGIVLLWVGFNALRKGVFFEAGVKARFEDIAIVPLACPMIAGPATIAFCIGLRRETSGYLLAATSLLLAIGINHVIMRLSKSISGVLTRFNILGALIRITGLVVMTMGTQMALDGITAWYALPQAGENVTVTSRASSQELTYHRRRKLFRPVESNQCINSKLHEKKL
jgi:multiple antibiotic resistance protein